MSFFRRRFGDEVVDAGLMGDRLSSQGIVAGNHHRAQTHEPELFHALADFRFEDVLERDDASNCAVCSDRQRRCAPRSHLGDHAFELRRNHALNPFDIANYGVGRAFADFRAVRQIDAAHARLRGEWHELRPVGRCERRPQLLEIGVGRDDALAFRRLVGHGSKCSQAHELAFRRDAKRNELARLTIADGDRPGLVEHHGVDVSCDFDRLAALGYDIGA